MSSSFVIQNEKLNQVAPLLQQHDIDAWMLFVRETNMTPDPSLDLVVGLDMTWTSAFIITQRDERVAIVGRYDVENVQKIGGFQEVIGYDADIYPHLYAVLNRLDPQSIGLNYSENDPAADGLTYGLWRQLNMALGETVFKHRLISAEPLITSLRGSKTISEIDRIRGAILTTESILNAVTEKLAVGQSEVEIHNMVRDKFREYGVKAAWSPCPIVDAGAEALGGHGIPDEKRKTVAGQLLHMDIGILKDDYVSDIQRVWYFKKEGETEIPEPIKKGFEVVRGAILAAAKVLKPGVTGWEVDQASRRYFVEHGYPEYQHAVGHQIGRSVHDGATLLGPKWARYGKTPEGKVEAGNVFTLELGVNVPDYGVIGLEEDVLVTEKGLEWLSTPQTEIMVIG